ncbi:MAG: NAD(P)H-dependent glycerol-3-phosphate dehydrogenase [Sulfuritalea sp.]|nr:NAD(P)H-dependent glycerol-3-phosphate dehydrogenase [Sulfuritalea sp.]MDP1983897.1 NAD(P)H-dependent glycerol-3-phosphate dehydrogenase [Sulfuritalea sp.]
MRIAVLGAGAWGTALAIAFAARHEVILWARDAVRVEDMARRRENPRYLPDCPFPPALQLTADFKAALAGTDLAILAAPLAGLRSLLEQIKADAPTLPFLWVCKGLEAGSGLLPHQVVAEVMNEAACGVLTGPSFALEVARGLPTAITLASGDAAFAEATAQRLHGGNLRIYANEDLIGAEVGGAVKNVLAIATGICDGLGLGLNARAALITRGLVEITRLGEAFGASRETFMGLAGMGDLILTCTGELSRNRRVGLLLAEGKALPEIVGELGHVAEGVPAAREVARRAAELGIDMPITKAVTAVLDGRMAPRAAVEQLMARESKHE